MRGRIQDLREDGSTGGWRDDGREGGRMRELGRMGRLEGKMEE